MYMPTDMAVHMPLHASSYSLSHTHIIFALAVAVDLRSEELQRPLDA